MKIVSTLFALIVLPSILSAQALVGSWQFDGNANDASGHNLNGTIYNATLTAGEAGIANTAYQFDGASSFISVPYDPMLNLTNWSVQTTLRVDGFNASTCQSELIMCKGVFKTGDWMMVGINDNAHDHDCAVYSPNFNEFAPGVAGTPNTGSDLHDANYIQIHTWYCHTVTYDGIYMKTFIDGALIDSVAWSNQYNYSGAGVQDSLVFGYYPVGNATGFPYWFNGAIDNISIYSAALSSAEVATMCFKTGVTNVKPNTEDLILSPNPSKGDFKITGAYNGKLAHIQIINSIGQTILKKQVVVNNKYLNEPISVSGFASGIYYVRVSGAATEVLKFTIE